MAMQIHSPQSIQRVAELVHAAAKAVADEHGVGLVVVVVDATERVQYQTNLGPTMTAGAFARCACLYDAKPAPVVIDPGVPHGVVVGSGITTHGPGGGVAGSSASLATGGNGSNGLYRSGIIISGAVCSVVSDPPNAGGEGRTGGSHATPPGGGGGPLSGSSPSNPPGAGEGRSGPSVVVMDQGGRVHESPPPLVIEVSPPAPSDEAAVPSYPGEGRKLDCPFIECKGCAQPIPAGDAYQLRVKGKLFAFHPGQFCPDCAARYDRGEIVLPEG